MRMVLQIAKAELRNLFYSPVAWFLAIAFFVQCAWYYTIPMYSLTKMQEAAIEMKPGFKDWGPIPLTALTMLSEKGVIAVALKNLFLFIPMLTMGLMSREVNSGTIKLLYSSPVKTRQIVSGKFMAIVAYNMVLLCILALMLISACFHIRAADHGMILSAMLGFFLVTCAYTAIGLFMSSLTNYQIVSAIGTFILLFILDRIGNLWQHLDFVRDLTYFLNISGRAEKLFKGLIRSKDVIYFLLVIMMFLAFTIFRLRAEKEARPWYIKLFRPVSVLVLVLTIGYISSRPRFTLYWDATNSQMNTVHQNTQALLSELKDEPLEVTLYTNLLGDQATYGFSIARNTYLSEVWEQYQRFHHNIRFRYVLYYFYDPGMDDGVLAKRFPGKNNEEMAREMAKGYKVDFDEFLPYSSFKDKIDLDPEGQRLVMTVRYKDRMEYLRTYPSAGEYPFMFETVYPNEENVAAVLKKLIHPESIPKILFTTGNLERDIYKTGEREFRYVNIQKSKRDAMINFGFECDTISLEHRDVPEGTTALVMVDPRTELSGVKQQKISAYLQNGGNMILLGEPGKKHVLNPLIRPLGVEILDGILVEPTYDEAPHMVKPVYAAASATISDDLLMQKLRKDLKSKFPYDTTKILMPDVAALSFSDSNGYVRKPLLLTVGTRTWLKKGKLVTDSADIIYSPEEGDIRGSFPTAMQLTKQFGGKQQRIVIMSDADFVSNRRVLNGERFWKSSLSWVSNNTFPVFTPRPDPRDNLLTATSKGLKKLIIVYVWVLPALLLIGGAVLLIRRKRK